MRLSKNEISLDLECWVDELSPAQLAAYERVTNEHNAVKSALKSALGNNEGKELFNGQVFQAYSFKGKVLQDLREATLPKKLPKAAEPPPTTTGSGGGGRGRKRASNFVYLASSEEDDDDIPLAKRIAAGKKGSPAGGKKRPATPTVNSSLGGAAGGASIRSTPLPGLKGPGRPKNPASSAVKEDRHAGTLASSPTTSPLAGGSAGSSKAQLNFKPSEITSVGGLVIGSTEVNKDAKVPKDNKEIKLQGKTFPSLVVLAKPWLKVRDMSATRSKLDSKVKLVLMLTPNKFTEWLIQEGLLKAEQKCINHRPNELKLGVYSDVSKFPYTGGYVWISDCCPVRFVSVFLGSIFEGAPHPPSCILKLIYHWACQTNIQNVVQWVKVDNVYIKGVYTWLRAVCTLAVHQKCKKLGGKDKFVEVGVISLGTTSQDGQQRQVKVEVLGVLDYSEQTIRLRAVEPVSDADRNYKKRFQTILEPLQRWVDKESTISIDLTVDKATLHSMGFKSVVQAAATDGGARHTNSAVMDYLRRIVPRMFQNTLSLLSRQMIQQFLDELVWREQFGTYAFQAFNNITTHIAEQTRMTTSNETLTQRLYQVATNPFKDWSTLPQNFKNVPANIAPKRLKKPISDADYISTPIGVPQKSIKKEKSGGRETPTTSTTSKKASAAAAAAAAAAPADDDYRPTPRKPGRPPSSHTPKPGTSPGPIGPPPKQVSHTTSASAIKKVSVPAKPPKDDENLRGLEDTYYGICDGNDSWFEDFPYTPPLTDPNNEDSVIEESALAVDCPICDVSTSFTTAAELQQHLIGHCSTDGKPADGTISHQCRYCLDRYSTESAHQKHRQIMHPAETKSSTSSSHHCLICQQRFNTLNFLVGHLLKVHSVLELPYVCQPCGYRSSSHRDLVEHFYEDHKHHNFLQCPFCVEVTRFSIKGVVSTAHIERFFMHVRAHITKRADPQLRCPKCALHFVGKGTLLEHMAKQHVSLTKNATQYRHVRPLLKSSVLIPAPKIRSHNREPLPYGMQQRFAEFYAFIDGSFCAECNSEILNEQHFPGVLKCNRCNYRTCCERAMYDHSACCSGVRDTMELPLPNEMHCVCGFSTAIGNKMARHLATCGPRTAYQSVEAALENTVKRNMLDMLGLVRRDGEGDAAGGEGGGEGEAGSGSGGGGHQEPIQFGEMEATPLVEELDDDEGAVMDDEDDQHHQDAHDVSAGSGLMEGQTKYDFDVSELGTSAVSADGGGGNSAGDIQIHHDLPPPQQQYTTIGYGQSEASDIDMPLIGELADPNPPATPQFLGEVHTPMFDAVAAAEQQHYHQLPQ